MHGVRHARAVEPSGTADFGTWSSSTTRYRKIGDLAAGGMGTVSLCVKQAGRFERLYAVKRLHPHLRRDDAMRRMFLDEARVAGLVRHANVVSVLDVGEDDEGPFLVMDYIEGTSLSRFITHHAAAGASIPVAVCAQIVAQAARGLHAAHELVDTDGHPLDLVHRDVSPANILLGCDGVVRVTDFGVAKALGRSTHTSTGLLKGKVGYMSPEHLRFETLDRRTDLWALGVVLAETLANRRLYSASDAAAAARRVLNDPPPDIGDERSDAPPALVELSYELLANNRDDRPATALEVADRLDEIVADLGHADVAAYLEATMGSELTEQRDRLRNLAHHVEPPTQVVEVGGTQPALPARVGERNRRPFALVGAIVLGGGLLAGLVWMQTRPGQTLSLPLSLAARAETADDGEVVSVSVTSTPAGAAVRLGDRGVGTTPLELELAATREQVELTLSLDGYETQTHDIMLTRNERLRVDLVPVRGEPAPVGEPSAPASPQDAAIDRTKRRKSGRARKGRDKPTSTANSDDPTAASDRPRFRRFD